ncbi:MAG TPA: ABC transporter permease [Bacteroidales bacterium]|nr:ABC transporter permease [Bacteroidales bacterium]HPR56941.1 ABC transporter permease [Bacteroidales bacterium]
MFLLIKLIKESYLFAYTAIISNKVRTLLSLLGITIGIFSVISVLSVFDSLERSIRNSFNDLGSNVIFIQKWPWMMGSGDYPWWKYMNRPEPTMYEMEEIIKRSNTAEAASFMFSFSRQLSFRNNTYDDVGIIAVSHDYERVMPVDIQEGRYFTRTESQNGRNVVIIGAKIAEELFPDSDPLGQTVKIGGNRANIIGILKRQGEGAFGNSNDEQVIVPVNFARAFVNMRNSGTTIVTKAAANVSNTQLMDELTGIMRSLRKLKPGEENDFALNEVSVINQGLQAFFNGLAIIGWIIGAFSLLVGGFGIANIMFVSVRERTNIIGIQKAIGAKNYFILLEFLFEAVFLSLLGGIIGLLLIYSGMIAFGHAMPFPLILSQSNILLGLIISTVIGLISGFVPAWVAARLDPVEAIRFGY